MKPIAHYIILFFISLWSISSWSHEIRPAYLQITQIDNQEYKVLWKIPAMGDMVLKIYPEFDSGFELKQEGFSKPVSGSVINTYTLTGSNELAGSHLSIVNLKKTMVDVLVTLEYLDGEKITLMLKPDSPEILLPGKASKWQVVKTYTILGIEHILLGFDHLLFVLALLILSTGFKKLLKTVTAFTVAHSITLSFSVLGLATLPGPPVEAVIALSIVFLAMEIVKLQQGKPSLTSQKPWLVAFSFGLLHGFGFAGALTDIGLPQTEIPLALATFNIGVELGQIIFVLAVLVFLRIIRSSVPKKGWLPKVVPYAIGSIAMFWTIERIVGFWV